MFDTALSWVLKLRKIKDFYFRETKKIGYIGVYRMPLNHDLKQDFEEKLKKKN